MDSIKPDSPFLLKFKDFYEEIPNFLSIESPEDVIFYIRVFLINQIFMKAKESRLVVEIRDVKKKYSNS